MSNELKTVAVTMGDPGGIGPEIIIKALSAYPPARGNDKLNRHIRFLLIGDEQIFQTASRLLKSDFKPKKIDSIDCLTGELPAGIYFLHLKSPTGVTMGQVNRANGTAAWNCLQTAIDLIHQHKISALVTAPVSKEAINLAGYPFTGHTEFLAKKNNARKVAMMFVGKNLKVSLVTTHLAYKKVPLYLSTQKILETILITDDWLKKYCGRRQPRLAVCGLNPHAGESGWLGSEEKNIIAPAVTQAKEAGLACQGPFPADNIFKQALDGAFEAVIALYHDQGLIPIKMFGFNESANITLGLPIIRTSPLHGTAFDLAGKGTAEAGSMTTAINLATEMCLQEKSLF
ncbi:MAG: 4-hydroxythreonine-4-phosphate dehydrogenase PdxA [Planctomycetota bacterium]